MSKPDILASKRPGFCLGRVVRGFAGQFSTWKRGEKVKIWNDDNGTVTVERVKWTGSLVPLNNSCYGVKANCVQIDKLKP